MAAIITRSMGWREMGLAVLVYPFYWMLHIGACIMALWELMFNPYLWRKTPHSMSTMSHPQPQ
jgi:hypothetical protein